MSNIFYFFLTVIKQIQTYAHTHTYLHKYIQSILDKQFVDINLIFSYLYTYFEKLQPL